MFAWEDIRENKRRGREGDVHAPRHDEHGQEDIGPVRLMDRCRRGQDTTGEKSGQRGHHEPGDLYAAEEVSRDEGGAETREGFGDELDGRGDGAGVSDGLEELEGVEDPDAEAAPAQGEAGHDADGVEGEDPRGEEGMRNATLDEAEGDEEEDAYDQDDVDVWCLPAGDGGLVPGEVDQDEACDSEDGAESVE